MYVFPYRVVKCNFSYKSFIPLKAHSRKIVHTKFYQYQTNETGFRGDRTQPDIKQTP